jgi:hypothetical protein
MLSNVHAKLIENAFLIQASKLLEEGKLDLKTSKEFGKEFLSLLPFDSQEDAHNKLKEFVNKHQEFEKVFIDFVEKINEENTRVVIDKLQDKLNNNLL